MSQLSVFWHHKRDILREIVDALEKVTDIDGPTKAKIATEILKAFHIGTGGVWGALYEQAVLAAIDFILAEVRWQSGGKPVPAEPSPPAPPVGGSIYYVPNSGTLPDDAALIGQGFKSGDVKFVNTVANKWMITETGGLGPAGWDQKGTIGG